MQQQEIKIAYIGGGSRGWAWNLMSDLAVEPDLCGTVKLYDIDMEAAKHNEIIGNRLKGREDVKGNFTYEAVSTLKDALTGCDFVVLSILPGTFDEMESDVHAPEKYGIYQSVGDTVGPGGIIRALRTLPYYIEFAEAIKEYCPEAWVINYTNPMTMCVQMMYKVFPEIKCFGCCHEVFGTQKVIAAMVQKEMGVEKVDRHEIKVNVQGINHFTWLNEISYKGIDLMPMYAKYAKEYAETGFTDGKDDNWMNNSFSSANMVKFDLFNRYGVAAAAGDRHLAEFCPPWYLKNPESVKSWKFGLTTVAYRKEQLKERLAKSARLVSGEEKMALSTSGEEGVMQMKALKGMTTLITNVNIPNYGQIPNLPLGSVVETNAVFSHNSVKPVFAGAIDPAVQALILPHCQNQRMTVEAVATKDLKLAYLAFCNDPLMTASCRDARVLFDEMINNTKKYLGHFGL